MMYNTHMVGGALIGVGASYLLNKEISLGGGIVIVGASILCSELPRTGTRYISNTFRIKKRYRRNSITPVLQCCLLLGIVYALTKGLSDSLILVGSSIVGSLLPDIDKENTFISNRLPLIASVGSKFGHRRVIHSPFLWTIIYAGLLVWLGNFGLGIYIGVMSHLIFDTFNMSGIPWLYPIKQRRYSIASIRTNSLGESLFRYTSLLLLTGMLYFIIV